MTNILNSLGAGSGIDVKALTQQLVDAERAPRQALLDRRLAAVDARISATGQFRGALSALVGALDSRISSGALSGQPQVSNPAVLGFTVDKGTTVERQAIEVRQLARGQTLASAAFPDATVVLGGGTITIRFGTVAGTADAGTFAPSAAADLPVAIDAGDSSLAGIRDAINDAAATAGAPVQAQIVTDADGARLMLRGRMGEASGFVVETAGDPALAAFGFSEGMTGGLQRTQAAADAIVALDGLTVRRPANVIPDLVPDTRITLSRAAPGEIIYLSAERSTSELSQSITDVAGALNELASLGRQLVGSGPGSAGALSADTSTRKALSSLMGLTSTPLIEASGSAPTRLADIGLSLDRYGSFTIDSARLAKAVANHPAEVEAMVNALNNRATPGKAAGSLRRIADGFAASDNDALDAARKAIARDQATLDSRTQRARLSYTSQFAALDRAVGQSKALQAYLDQQMKMWTRNED